jgi:hypothetical protein
LLADAVTLVWWWLQMTGSMTPRARLFTTTTTSTKTITRNGNNNASSSGSNIGSNSGSNLGSSNTDNNTMTKTTAAAAATIGSIGAYARAVDAPYRLAIAALLKCQP